MRGADRSTARRITAGVMGLTLLLVVLLSVCFLAAEADHDCAGEDCPICAVMQLCRNTLRRFCLGTFLLPAAALAALALLPAAARQAPALPQATPVSSAVRMND